MLILLLLLVRIILCLAQETDLLGIIMLYVLHIRKQEMFIFIEIFKGAQR